MKIFGYSERGIINSLIFSIGEDKELMDKFIGLIGITEIELLKDKVKDYTILLEQSFSRFGDSDLVIIIEYENTKDKKVLFIEGKVNTSSGNWNIQTQFKKYIEPIEDENKIKPDDYWSILFSQLYLKKLLIENWNNIKNDDQFELNDPYLGIRKIGTNPIVKKAFELIECLEKDAYYIGLIPTNQEHIDKFEGKTDFDIHFLSWKKVHDFCKKDEKLKKVREIFDYNEGQIYKYDELIQ